LFTLEDRVASAQPTPLDTVAQMAFGIGLGEYLSQDHVISWWRRHVSPRLPRDNWLAAQDGGPNAVLRWPLGRKRQLTRIDTCDLVGNVLIGYARAGLASIGVNTFEVDWLMDVIAGRATACETGSTFQIRSMREELANLGGDPAKAASAMFARYRTLAATGQPVHSWRGLEPSLAA
jgi:hypothetical protein